MSQPSYSYQPQSPQPMTPDQERQWGMIAHLAPIVAALLSAGVFGFLGSLVVYLLYRERGPFVRAHSANSLNIQIWAVIYMLLAGLITILTIGLAIPLLFIPPLWALVLNVIGAMKANSGEWWDPPLTPRILS